MEKGNRSTSSSRLGEIPSYDCDVNLGLNMQEQQGGTSDGNSSYPSKRAMISPHFLPFQQHPYPHPHPNHHHIGGSAYFDDGGSGGGLGGSHLFNSTNNQLFTTHDAALTHAAGVAAMRAPFTTQQWHELERQNMIFKYLTSYNSAPAHLLSPFSRNPTSQINTSGMDMKFSSGSDPEPWRCRRTDGKKWRCTRDVAPDQKYCERHAHKSRPRSRKHVEIQSHNNNNNNNSTTKFTQQIDPQNPFSISSTKGSSATSYDQTRGIEWLMKGGSGPSSISKVSTCNVEQKQKQQHNQPSARMGFSEGSSDFYKNPTVFQQQENDQGNQESIQLNPYMGNDYYPYFDPKVMNSSSQRSPTRHFTDAWPLDEIGNSKGPFSIASGCRELPLSSLTLSMSGGDTLLADNDPESKKSQWMASNVSWLNSTGGPLGEALCLGNAGTRKGTSDLPSPYGCSTNSNTTSTYSKGSCEEGNHQFNFIG